MVLRAAYALLSRRYDIRNERAISFAFTKRGQGQAKGYLNDTQEMFEARNVFQDVESVNVEFAIVNDGLAKLKNKLDCYPQVVEFLQKNMSTVSSK